MTKHPTLHCLLQQKCLLGSLRYYQHPHHQQTGMFHWLRENYHLQNLDFQFRLLRLVDQLDFLHHLQSHPTVKNKVLHHHRLH
jgi:hypothetical protein